MSEIINNTTNENETTATEHTVATTNLSTDDVPIKLHVLKTTGKTQDIALMQIGDKNLLIDSGISDYATNYLTILKDTLGVTKIDYIYITHYHWDHAGGLTKIGNYTKNADGTTSGNGIDMYNATIYLPDIPIEEYYKQNYYVRSILKFAANKCMTIKFPGNLKRTISNVDDVLSIVTDTVNRDETIVNIEGIELEFKNCNANDYYYNIDKNGGKTLKTAPVTETRTVKSEKFNPGAAILNKYGDSKTFKITTTKSGGSVTVSYKDVTKAAGVLGTVTPPEITVAEGETAVVEYYEVSVDYNDTSLCCVMTYGKTRIGFFGDIGLKAQETLSNTIGHLDLMNVEHHGRNGGHYRPFYDSIAPKMCFTQDGNGNDGNDHILSAMSKTQEYLQENSIPNYPISANETTMTFNIYKSGVSTKANSAKYAVKIKGATSILGAVQDDVPGTNGNISLYNLLNNMEHGTFLSCALRDNNIQLGQLFETLNIAEAEYAEFIVYKNGSIYNNSQLTIEKKLDSGYIMLIPHSKNPTCNPVTAYWYLDLNKENNPAADIEVVFKPIRDTEYFKFFKSASSDSDFKNATGFENSFLTCNGLTITPKNSCLVNYSILLRNQNATTSKAVTINDGESERIITIPAKGYVTLTNVVNLSKTDTISIPTAKEKLGDLYVRVSGYVTAQTQTITKTLHSSDNAIFFPYYGGYPYF
ncbi:MAG: MBL fold metallo-hydrolase [Clostridia bacterium]|nr:MBL fold metallo-hydrolase [Clostridia bacterium]